MTQSDDREKIGLFGGTFDPPHLGHFIAAQSAFECAGLDSIVFLPSASPPHKAGLNKGPRASLDHRLAMTRTGAEGNPKFHVSDRERNRPGPSYTVELMRELVEENGPRTGLYFIIGADWVSGLASWRSIDEIFELGRFLVLPRPGIRREDVFEKACGLSNENRAALAASWIDAPEIGISSTWIRERIRLRLPVNYLLPPGVDAYIRENGLYL